MSRKILKARALERDVLQPMRADAWVRMLLPLWSRREVAELFAQGRVRDGGRIVHKGEMLLEGMRLTLNQISGAWIFPRWDGALRVVFESSRCVVLDKPAGVPCQPHTSGGAERTVVDGLCWLYPEMLHVSDDLREGGLCHRLDNGTSGLLVAARTPEAYSSLRRYFSDSASSKCYLAVIEGRLDEAFLCTMPIGHHRREMRRMTIDPDLSRTEMRAAETRVTPLHVEQNLTLVKLEMRGGRRHQIRVHLSSSGYPIVGDALYGGSVWREGMHALHASRLFLPEIGSIYCEPPAAWSALISKEHLDSAL